MKNQIYKFNQFLLERYPTVWNTRIIWMLAASLIIHICFFFFGFFTLVNPQSLTDYSVLSSYFENGMFGLGLVISLILLVVWIVTLFRNNAFKNFYPTSAWDLFKQFCAYMIIIIASTSFYFSFTLGLQAYVKINYPQERIANEHRVVNDSYMFLSETLYKYTLDERILPKQLDTLYCERRETLIDSTQPFLKFKEVYYQYYSLTEIKVPKKEYDAYESSDMARQQYDTGDYDLEEAATVINNIDTTYNGSYLDSLSSVSVSKIVKDDYVSYYVKNKIINVSSFIETAIPSYYNFSDIFYEKDGVDFYPYNDYGYNDDYGSDNDYSYSPAQKKQIIQVKRNHELLDNNNPAAIKKLLQEQIAIMDNYGIKHNLTADKWFKLVYHPSAFPVKNLIGDSKYSVYDKEYLSQDATALQKHIRQLETKNYIEIGNLHRVYENLDEVHDTNIFENAIHIFLWIAFFVASILFIFRTTGLRELLFSTVTAGVLGIIIGLLGALISYGGGNYSNSEYVFSYVALIIGLIIFTVALTSFTQLRKIISAILLNLTFVYFIPWLFLILGIISIHQSDACDYTMRYETNECFTILESLGLWWSYIFIVLGLLFVYLFSYVIIKWRSLPEQ